MCTTIVEDQDKALDGALVPHVSGHGSVVGLRVSYVNAHPKKDLPVIVSLVSSAALLVISIFGVSSCDLAVGSNHARDPAWSCCLP